MFPDFEGKSLLKSKTTPRWGCEDPMQAPPKVAPVVRDFGRDFQLRSEEIPRGSVGPR